MSSETTPAISPLVKPSESNLSLLHQADVVDAFLEALQSGHTIRDAARAIGVSERNVHRQIRRSPDLAAAVDRARTVHRMELAAGIQRLNGEHVVDHLQRAWVDEVDPITEEVTGRRSTLGYRAADAYDKMANRLIESASSADAGVTIRHDEDGTTTIRVGKRIDVAALMARRRAMFGDDEDGELTVDADFEEVTGDDWDD